MWTGREYVHQAFVTATFCLVVCWPAQGAESRPSLEPPSGIVVPQVASVGQVGRTAQAPRPSGEPFGQCAHPSSLEVKLATCSEASKATDFPWILHWVYRELARAQRQHGQQDKATVSYARSLAAREDAAVRQEMESLAPPTQ